METINFTWNDERKRYEKQITASSAFQIRITNPDLRGVSILEVYSLSSENENPVLILRAANKNNILDKTISLDGYPRNILLSLSYMPSLAEMQYNSPNGSVLDETVLNTIKNLAGSDETSESAITPNIDSVKEMTDFLEGYNNDEKLSDVINDATSLAEEPDIDNLFK